MIWYAIDWFWLILAIGVSRPRLGLALICVAELSAGAVIPPWPGLAMTDVIFGMMLWQLNYSARTNFIAFLFAIMAVASAILHGNGYSEAATSAIVDGIAWLAFGVLGHVDGGIARLWRKGAGYLNRHRRRDFGLSDLALSKSTNVAGEGAEKDCGGING